MIKMLIWGFSVTDIFAYLLSHYNALTPLAAFLSWLSPRYSYRTCVKTFTNPRPLDSYIFSWQFLWGTSALLVLDAKAQKMT